MIDRAAPAHPLRTNRCFVFMRSILGILSAVLILFPLGLTARAEKVEQLKPQGYVNDFAGVLSAPARSQMTALCAEVDQKAHAQVAVVTIRSLEGVPTQEFANRLFKQWAVGYKPDDRGVLVLLAVSDRKYWVEVGYGLEPILPDGKVGGFGREIVPLLRQNDYGGAMLQLTSRIAEVIAQDRGVTLGSRLPMKPRERESRRIPQGAVLLFLLAIAVIGKVIGFLVRLFTGGGNPRGRGRGLGLGGGWWFLGGGGGGGWGGGGFGVSSGGGGFGGFGGGGSGGGGAGGGW
ncbi:MAG: methanol dehydrogenase [Acidobacteria bacterium]|nr:MAG: methanol dehydrogenase [Acidobacteriota bacterium]